MWVRGPRLKNASASPALFQFGLRIMNAPFVFLWGFQSHTCCAMLKLILLLLLLLLLFSLLQEKL